jgi:zinc transport system ATP-binding protein
VEEGDYIAIVGENGTGKSTLVKSMLGLIKPVFGEILMDELLRKEGIGYLPQQNQGQREFPATVFEVVLSGFLNTSGYRPFYLKREKMKALENLKKLQIKDLKRKYYGELSGGQQQRVLLARALCATGNFIILDEPVTGLDPGAANQLYQQIEYLNKVENVTILMVSHDFKNTITRAKTILHLGKDDYFFGSVESYLETSWSKKFMGGEQL